MRTFDKLLVALALAGSLGAALPVAAQGVYKHVDKDGKVYYSDKPPAKDDTTAKKVDVDSKRNVIPALAKKQGEGVQGDRERIDNRIDNQNRLLAELEAAREQVAAAKEALLLGKTPTDDEWTGVGAGGKRGGGGGGGRVPSEAYHERIAAMERSVAKAEEQLAKAETAYRRGTSN